MITRALIRVSAVDGGFSKGGVGQNYRGKNRLLQRSASHFRIICDFVMAYSLIQFQILNEIRVKLQTREQNEQSS